METDTDDWAQGVSEARVRQREQLARELGEPPALSPAVRKLLSAEGFLDYFLEARMLFPTYEDAYGFLEEQHERLTGEWMYSEYDSFRAVYKRWLKRQKRRAEALPKPEVEAEHREVSASFSDYLASPNAAVV